MLAETSALAPRAFATKLVTTPALFICAKHFHGIARASKNIPTAKVIGNGFAHMTISNLWKIGNKICSDV
jgi:hypothetical protein